MVLYEQYRVYVGSQFAAENVLAIVRSNAVLEGIKFAGLAYQVVDYRDKHIALVAVELVELHMHFSDRPIVPRETYVVIIVD